MLVIILFILILNIVSLVLMYKCLTNSSAKEKLVFMAVGTALMYVLVSFVFWIGAGDLELTESAQLGKDLIIFAFVPVNGIIVLPFFAKSYSKYKGGSIQGNVLRNRGILLAIVLIILLVLEGMYFKNMQEQLTEYIQNQQETEQDYNAQIWVNGVLTNVSVDGGDAVDEENTNTENVVNVSNSIVVNEVSNSVETENSVDTNTENTMQNSNNVSSNIVNSAIAAE